MITRKKAFSLMELVIWFFVSTLCLTIAIKVKFVIANHLECQSALMHILDKSSFTSNSYKITYDEDTNTITVISENESLLKTIHHSLKKMQIDSDLKDKVITIKNI